MKLLTIILLGLCLYFNPTMGLADTGLRAAEAVLQRALGAKVAERFDLKLTQSSKKNQSKNKQLDEFTITTNNNKVSIKANSPVALTRASYHYLKQQHHNIISWSGDHIELPQNLDDVTMQGSTPYQYRYYFNVVTHGYTTAYWDWQRWSEEIDWMAMHGINMPLIPGAHEAILYRVFRQLGLTDAQSRQYFSGPAHFPWNRMGNLTAWDGAERLPRSYFAQQIALNHKILKRMRALGMTPIVHAFAGFVPSSIKQLMPPKANVGELGWGGGLPKGHNGFILSPNNPMFKKIGKLYIELWEKEFGENQYYLADSFNEMDVPPAKTEALLLAELAAYGHSAYQAIKAANPNAVWVMQGWTFPYHKDENGQLFWTPQRLAKLVSKVPDDKLLILDLANEYNHVFWQIDPSWKMYDGFFNKQWIYSFIPNMGGKTPLNGKLDVYASIPINALNYGNKRNLVGFGFAPEGIENNEMIYELLTDMAWRTTAIDLKVWQKQYALQRYGAYPEPMQRAFALLNQSALGSFTDHPMHRFQLRPYLHPEGVENHATVHDSKVFYQAVDLFLQASKHFEVTPLYQHDAIQMTTQLLGLIADDLLRAFLSQSEQKAGQKRDIAVLNEALDVLAVMDRLLASHPNQRLDLWVRFARSWGENDSEKDYYESNAKRLLTTWGGDPVNDYSGRVWAGLIGDYYIPRWRLYHQAKQQGGVFDVRQWEEKWINMPYVDVTKPYVNPLNKAMEALRRYSN